MEWFDQAAYSTAELLRTAAHLAEQSGDLSQAERLYMRLLTVLETKIGRGSIETADVMRSLAELSYKAGNFEDGTRYFEKMQKILEERRGAN
jgi:tetratricopeptide (TPR) repeat protein